MNKIILSHLNNLAAKAEKCQNVKWAYYKPLSPFQTNKIKRIDENINEPQNRYLQTLLKQNSYEELY